MIPGTIRHLQALGVSKGWRCLEIGAGAGSIAAWLCEQVDADGSVVAIDLDTRLIDDMATGALTQAGFEAYAQLLESPAFLAQSALMIAAWGQRPS